jgi:hypothetical protein
MLGYRRAGPGVRVGDGARLMGGVFTGREGGILHLLDTVRAARADEVYIVAHALVQVSDSVV